MTANFKRRLDAVYKGLLRDVAAKKSDGSEELKTGKDPLKFDLHRWVRSCMLSQDGHDFSKHILSWNLMSRINTTAGVCFTHLEWMQDALSIYFGVTKTDQASEHPKDTRHIYANPLMPEICPVLLLQCTYILCNQYDTRKLSISKPSSLALILQTDTPRRLTNFLTFKRANKNCNDEAYY